ncbi:hypothetical protein CVT26_015205, partial [Gymnopilus dilepis]
MIGNMDILSQPPIQEDFLSDYSEFVEAVRSGECGIYKLTEGMYVVGGWNVRKRQFTGSWYHLQYTKLAGEISILCLCPASNNHAANCFHARYLTEEVLMLGDLTLPQGIPGDDDRAFLFYRCEDVKDDQYHNLFSVPSQTRFSNMKNRAIVEHRGDDSGTGTWKCNKDSGAILCPHIVAARHSLQKYIRSDWEALDETLGDNAMDGITFGGLASSSDDGISESVSYFSLPPPIWARIRSDPYFSPRTTFSSPPPLISLDDDASCSCSSPRAMVNPLGPRLMQKCTVYMLHAAEETMIEVQRCSKCSHRFVGPECSKLGIFNLNNRTLVAHDLLDDYTSAFSSSETPFVAWVQTTSHRYLTRRSPIPFMSDKLFRQCWFSYMRLIQFGTDQICSHCGPTPDLTIWDGVTVAFSRKNLLPTLRPPTTTSRTSVPRTNVKLKANLQIIPTRSIRQAILF